MLPRTREAVYYIIKSTWGGHVMISDHMGEEATECIPLGNLPQKIDARVSGGERPLVSHFHSPATDFWRKT